jgi:adenylate cyclase
MRLAKLLRLLDAPERSKESISRERHLFDSEALEARTQLDRARSLVPEVLRGNLLSRERDELVRLSVLLDELLTRSVDNLSYAHQLIAATENRDLAGIATITPVAQKAEDDMLSAGATNVENARRMLQTMIFDVVQEHSQIARLSYLVSGIAAILGILFSAIVIRGLVRPVSNLMRGVTEVQEGKLDVKLEVISSDEIGALTRSFNVMVGELRMKEQLKNTFGKYLDPRIVDTLLAQGTDLGSGQREVMTVFFSDLVGFTTISERLTPSGLVNVMNRYFSLMSAPIRVNHGLIDKYIGDAIMAFWGPPFTQQQEHARLACFAALDQLTALQEFRRILPELMGQHKGLPVFDFRIGIATGDVVVGSIGCDSTRSFTVLGDTVNLGSRLEGANNQYGTRVLLSEDTEKLVRGVVETREIDLIAVKGKTDPVRVYELLARSGQLPADMAQLRDIFENGLTLYRRMEWRAAAAAFGQCLAIIPTDEPSSVYLKRVCELEANPPQTPWDGVWHLSSK